MPATLQEKQVILTLSGGDLEQGFLAVTMQTSLDQHLSQRLKASGTLPPAPQLDQNYRDWQAHYLALQDRLRIQLVTENTLNQVSRERFEQLSEQLSRDLNQWLGMPGFQRIDQQLRLYLNPEDPIRLILETDCPNTRRLPWHLWLFFRDYPQAEFALGSLNYRPVGMSEPVARAGTVRILAILGNSVGIDVAGDRTLLSQLPQADTQFLVEPSRSQLHEALWAESGWDILFFAGHSQSHLGDATGQIAINSTESLTIEQLDYALGAAIARGLQLAIFNSCDGLGLARGLATLNLPQLIVMREPVPDPVAQAFLKHFLRAFAGGQPFYKAVREAREKLQALEDQFLCASWLPVIHQNPAAMSLTWQVLTRLRPSSGPVILSPTEPTRTESALTSVRTAFPWRFTPALVRGAIATLLLLGLRFLGFLQPFELFAYDLLLRQRPAETTDPHILVVEVTQADTLRYGYPLEDKLLAQLLKKLYSDQPRAVGLDMHRAQPRGEGRAELLEQFRLHPSLSTVCWSGGSDPNFATPPEFDSTQQTQQLAFSDLQEDFPALSWLTPDRIRRQLLSVDPNLGELSDCTAIQGLSLRLAHEFLGAEDRKISLDDRENWVLDQTVLPSLPRRFGAYQQLEGLSSQILINYRGAQPGQGVSLETVLSGQLPAGAVGDRIVLIGTTAPVGQDILSTPLGEMPGVWVHAHQLSQLLSAVLDRRPLIWTLPQWNDWQWGDGLWIMAWTFLGSGLGQGLQRDPKQNPPRFQSLLWGSGVGGVMVLYGVSLGAIAQGLWLPLVPSVLGWMLGYGLGMHSGLRSNLRSDLRSHLKVQEANHE